jgi:hypothetical protein
MTSPTVISPFLTHNTPLRLIELNTDPTEVAWREIRKLHNELHDPFVMMPMQSAAVSLNQALSEVESHFNERTYGVSRKYWDVPMELLHEEKGFIIGNAFVLAQVAIAQAVAIFGRLRKHCNNCGVFPDKKEAILNFESETTLHSGLSEIIVIESVANYFKHQHEWPEDWDESAAIGIQKNTLRVVMRIGMTPRDLTDNMAIALSDLNSTDDLASIAYKVQLWRERLALRLSNEPEIANSIEYHATG